MTLELKPELEALIQKRLKTGAFSSPEEVVERALEFLNEEEDWLTDHRDAMAAQIQEGWNDVQRGELTGSAEVRTEMLAFKEDWEARRRPA